MLYLVVGKVYDDADVWFNFGLIDKAPIFDQVIQDWDAKMASDPKNEKFTAFEFGLNARSNDGSLAGKLNVYNTAWNDRIATKYVQNEEGDDDIIYLTGINQNHFGIETEFAAQFNEMFRLDIGIGWGKWEFTDDATGTYRDSDGSDSIIQLRIERSTNRRYAANINKFWFNCSSSGGCFSVN